MAECKGHTPGSIPLEVGKLPESQADFWRHKCAACAYLLGTRHAAQTEENLRNRVRTLDARVAELEALLTGFKAN